MLWASAPAGSASPSQPSSTDTPRKRAAAGREIGLTLKPMMRSGRGDPQIRLRHHLQLRLHAAQGGGRRELFHVELEAGGVTRLLDLELSLIERKVVEPRRRSAGEADLPALRPLGIGHPQAIADLVVLDPGQDLRIEMKAAGITADPGLRLGAELDLYE